MTVTRFAPSPNGSLHLGHAYAAIVAHDRARQDGGRFQLRIEDIDGTRSRPKLAEEFRADLEWLGLEWEEVPPQSARLASYDVAARNLLARGLLYPCTCTRAEIEALEPHLGPDGLVYPGTCKSRELDIGKPLALRFDVDKAMAKAGEIWWEDELAGRMLADPREAGDVVIVRKDSPASYHLAVTLDDASDGVTLVTRGQDLFYATNVHRLLQALLGLPVPRWHHHGLLMDESGRKLSKSRHSPSLADRRRAGEDGLALAEEMRQGRFPAGITLAST